MTQYIWKFGTAELHEARRELRIKGQRVRCQPLALRVLIQLLRAHGNLVTRDQLLDSSWGRNADVMHGAIDQAVSRLRARLGDNRGVIMTRHCMGYMIDFRQVTTVPLDGDDDDGSNTPAAPSEPGQDCWPLVAAGPGGP